MQVDNGNTMDTAYVKVVKSASSPLSAINIKTYQGPFKTNICKPRSLEIKPGRLQQLPGLGYAAVTVVKMMRCCDRRQTSTRRTEMEVTTAARGVGVRRSLPALS